ncbi:hypothetical protein [Thalassobacillus sp. C254]|uniref:hypothetical protein n=1 Tax=Thalassobacillus sp. C254 TaxID=1225341 RepID=UPI0012EECCCF|nr:hypothetical protein [Thalassobacillus sp. C254]
MTYAVTIPYCYVWLTKGYENRGVLFKHYVESYVKRTYPEMELVKIQGMKAIVRRREE